MTYDASHIQVLEGLEAVRKRPGMYIGSTGERGLRYLVFEVVERAAHEILSGRASRMEVTLLPGGGVRVADDGTGVRVDGFDLPLTVLTACHGGPGRHDVTAGFHGVGLSVVNALSSRMRAEVRQDGVSTVWEYARGVAATQPTPPAPEPKRGNGNGTTFWFWPDPEIFETTDQSFAALAERFRELAFLNRPLDISLIDEREPAEPTPVRFRFPGGVRDFVAYLDGEPSAPDIVGFDLDDPDMEGEMEIAWRWTASSTEQIRSFANSQTTHGGTHERGFRDGMADAINAYARERQLLAETDSDLGDDPIGEGLIAVVAVRLDHPQLQGCLRDTLGNGPVRARVRAAVREHLSRWLGDHPEQADALISRMVARTIYFPFGK
ncbi:MAG: DNA gyrase subunit B [Catenulispora sp.]|nr:DNA gyrase subunit B [Catenulispora sp.]